MQFYLKVCESWWQDWLAGSPRATDAVRARFDLDAAPEPYLPFEPGSNPLVVLTTNPGATMPHQRRAEIMAGKSQVSSSMNYVEAAEALSRFYLEHLSGVAARRIRTQCALATESGYTGVFQVECCPWHSPALPGKTAFVQLLSTDAALMEYTQALRGLLQPSPVLAISAVSSRDSLASSSMTLSPWLAWQSDMIGLSHSHAELVPLVWKGNRVTSAALVDRTGPPKVMVLMQGGNHLPGEGGRAILALALRSIA